MINYFKEIIYMCDLIKLLQEQRIQEERKNNQSLFHKPFLLQDNVKFFVTI